MLNTPLAFVCLSARRCVLVFTFLCAFLVGFDWGSAAVGIDDSVLDSAPRADNFAGFDFHRIGVGGEADPDYVVELREASAPLWTFTGALRDVMIDAFVVGLAQMHDAHPEWFVPEPHVVAYSPTPYSCPVPYADPCL